MATSDEIRATRLPRRLLGGYRRADVDAFRDRMAVQAQEQADELQTARDELAVQRSQGEQLRIRALGAETRLADLERDAALARLGRSTPASAAPSTPSTPPVVAADLATALPENPDAGAVLAAAQATADEIIRFAQARADEVLRNVRSTLDEQRRLLG